MGIVIVGGGGLAKEIFYYAVDASALTEKNAKVVRGFAAHPEPEAATLALAPWLGHEDELALDGDDTVVIAIGDTHARRNVADRLRRRGARFHTLVHPTAWMAPSAALAEGCMVAPFAHVGPSASLGPHTLLGRYASVAHDAATGAFCTLSPYAVINGGACLEDGVFLGTHATVLPKIRIGRNARVAPGAVVRHDVPAGALVAGNPARGRVVASDEDEKQNDHAR